MKIRKNENWIHIIYVTTQYPKFSSTYPIIVEYSTNLINDVLVDLC